jgi:carbon starvation protein
MFAVVSAYLLALFPRPGDPWSWETIGKGGMILWPMFGATNQLLGGLAFLVITFWLWRRGKAIWFVALPTVFMLLMPAWSLIIQLGGWWSTGSYLLVFIGVVTLALEVWMLAEALAMFPRVRGVMEEALPPLGTA